MSQPHAANPVARLARALLVVLLVLGPGACTSPPADAPAAPYTPRPTYTIEVSRPAGPPRVKTSRVDALGRPVTVGCPTCHALPDFGTPARASGQPTELFHQGLVVQHGELLCRSCHEAPGYAGLHLADGRALPFVEVQALCRQCHGPQARDFDRGSHGGMRGYWDLSRGPRQRHHCTVCHDPHAPAYVGMLPARGPVDPRFGTPAAPPPEEH